VVSSQARRDQVALAIERGHPKRRACELIGIARSTLRYERRLPLRDAPVLSAMCRLAQQYPRYGDRRIRIFLKREGHEMSWQRAHRLWQVAGLQLPKRRPRRRIAASRPRPLPPTGPNSVWAYDFVYDACANGQQIKCLTVSDEFTRECLAIDVAGSIRSKRVIDVLSRLVSERGAPRVLRSDNVLKTIGNQRHGKSIRYRGAEAPRRQQRASSVASSLPQQRQASADHSGNKIRHSATVVRSSTYLKQRRQPSGRSEHYLWGPRLIPVPRRPC